jgi:hypothetical protein
MTLPILRGRTYGTILVDLESHRPVDLLADRSADTFSRWLLSHPGVEVISRDRSTEYQRGATEGAPHAQQVIDRWHLLKNLREALERLLIRLHEGLAQLPAAPNEVLAARPRQKRTRAEVAASTASRMRRLARVRASRRTLQARRQHYWDRQATPYQPSNRSHVCASWDFSRTGQGLSHEKPTRSLPSVSPTALGAGMPLGQHAVARTASTRIFRRVYARLSVGPTATRCHRGDADQQPPGKLFGQSGTAVP